MDDNTFKLVINPPAQRFPPHVYVNKETLDTGKKISTNPRMLMGSVMADDIIDSTMCQWEVEGFMEKIEQCEDGIFTTVFESGRFANKTKFQMKFSILGINKDLIEVYYLTNKAMFIRSTLFLKARNHQLRMVAEHDWKNVYSNTWQYITGFMTSDIKENPQGYIYIGGKLVLCLKVEVMECLKDKKNEHSMQNNLCELFQSGESADVDVISGDNTVFRAHKLILTCRSPVFAAMLKHDMLEGKTDQIHLKDLESTTLKQLLSYMYTDNCPQLAENAEELLQVADKYQLFGLKHLCEEAIFENVTTETAVHALLLADLYNAKRLRQLVLKYIKDGQVKDVFKTNDWKDIESCNLLKDLLEQLLL